MRIRRGGVSSIGLGVAVVALALAGCAATPTPSASPTHSAAPVPSPTPTPTFAAAPQQLFGGDCGTVLSLSEVSAATGFAMTAGASGSTTTVTELTPKAVGGILCSWSKPAAKGQGEVLRVVAIPSSTAGVKVVRTYCYGSDAGAGLQPACSFGGITGAVSFSGVYSGTPHQSTATAKAAVVKLMATLTTHSASQTAPPPYVPEGIAWPGIASCPGFEKYALIAPSVASPGLRAEQGNGPSEQPENLYIAMKASFYSTCIYEQRTFPTPKGEVPGFTFESLPAGAWIGSTLASLPGATPVTIPRADSAWLITNPVDGSGSFAIEALAGPNWLVVEGNRKGQDPATLYPAVTRLIAELDGPS